MVITQVMVFNDYDDNAIDLMNEFMEKVDVVDVKMQTIASIGTYAYFTQYMVVYKKEIRK